MNIKNITIRDVALKANTSIRTVSRVLNNSDLVNIETRKRVLKVIKKLDFKPNIIARNLSYKKTKTIGVILISFVSGSLFPIMEGIESITELHGYKTILCGSGEDFEKEKEHIDNLVGRMVEGLIIMPTSNDYTYINKIADSETNIVLIGYAGNPINNNIIGYVYNDDYYSMTNVIEYLINKGHKNILFINTYLNLDSKFARLDAYITTLKKHKISFNPGLIFDSRELSVDGGFKAAKEFFKKDLNFTAIICFNDFVAIGVLQYCRENKIKVPEDISIMGYDDDKYINPHLSVPLSSVHNYKKKLGFKAAELLFDKINKKEIKKHIIRFKPKIVERESVRKIN